MSAFSPLAPTPRNEPSLHDDVVAGRIGLALLVLPSLVGVAMLTVPGLMSALSSATHCTVAVAALGAWVLGAALTWRQEDQWKNL